MHTTLVAGYYRYVWNKYTWARTFS